MSKIEKNQNKEKVSSQIKMSDELLNGKQNRKVQTEKQKTKKIQSAQRQKVSRQDKTKKTENKPKNENIKNFDSSIDELNIEEILSSQNKNEEEIEYIRVSPKDRLPLEKIKRFNPSPETGLEKKQVYTRYEEGYANEIVNKTTKSYPQIIFGTIFTFFNILCFAIAGALIAIGSYRNLTFLAVIVANIVIAIVQEVKAKTTVEKITLLTTPTARVIRDSKECECKVNDVVLDDILKLSNGGQVCADAIIVEGECEVNESLLTGESKSIKKRKGDMVYAGSYLTSGKCFARVDRIGDDTYSAKLVAKAKLLKKNQSELLKNMRLITRIISFIIIPLAIGTFLVNRFALPGDTAKVIEKTSGSVVGMIPAGMYLLTSLALAVGVIKLAKKKTLVQDLYSIEMLSRVDVLCLDKTGTITDGTMKVSSVIGLSKNEQYSADEIIGSMLTALGDNNQTAQALLAHFGYSRKLTPIASLPFSSQRKLSAVTFQGGTTYIMGAPGFVTKKINAELERQIKNYAARGLRVLLLAKTTGKITDDKLPDKEATPIYLIVIEDHIRESAYETIKWFKENDVQIKIISGDDPITVSEISKRVGVANAHKFISLEGLSNKQVVEAANEYTVFGRVTPEQKCILIKSIKALGHKVAMTGDGVNDILALKESDCSIAMASGSEAARNVANVVLLNSDFSSMPDVVSEGRRVVNNVSKSSSLFLMKTFFMFFVALFCMCARICTPFDPNQLFLLETFVIGIPTFVLALQPNKDRIRGKFLNNFISKAIPGSIIFSLIFVTCFIFNSITMSGPDVQAVTSTMTSLGVFYAGLLILLRICKPFDVVRLVMYIGVVAASTLILTLVPFSFFSYTKLELVSILLLICIIEFSGVIYSSVVRWTESLFALKSKSKLGKRKKIRIDE